MKEYIKPSFKSIEIEVEKIMVGSDILIGGGTTDKDADMIRDRYNDWDHIWK